MKKYIILSLTSLSIISAIIKAHAIGGPELELYLPCTGNIGSCAEVSYIGDQNEKLNLPKKPFAQISKDEISEGKMTEAYMGEKKITLQFKGEAKHKIGIMTYAQPGVPLIFVSDGKIVFSAQPEGPIMDGFVAMKAPNFAYSYETTLKKLPWLNKILAAHH